MSFKRFSYNFSFLLVIYALLYWFFDSNEKAGGASMPLFGYIMLCLFVTLFYALMFITFSIFLSCEGVMNDCRVEVFKTKMAIKKRNEL